MNSIGAGSFSNLNLYWAIRVCPEKNFFFPGLGCHDTRPPLAGTLKLQISVHAAKQLEVREADFWLTLVAYLKDE